jgi:RNA polymerase-binding transcription factor DksA
MDSIDMAHYLEEFERADAMRRFRAGVVTEPSVAAQEGVDRSCRDCDVIIPDARLAAQPHALRCIDCQQEYDREMALLARLFAGGESNGWG